MLVFVYCRCSEGYTGNPQQPGDYCKIGPASNCECDSRGTVPNTQCDESTLQCQCKVSCWLGLHYINMVQLVWVALGYWVMLESFPETNQYWAIKMPCVILLKWSLKGFKWMTIQQNPSFSDLPKVVVFFYKLIFNSTKRINLCIGRIFSLQILSGAIYTCKFENAF